MVYFCRMNISQKSFRIGISLFMITMLLFFLLLFVFSTQGRMTEAQYFNYSVMISCFLLPVIYAGFAFYNIYGEASIRPLGFRHIWRLSFLPMFIGGLLSLAAIFVFFNTSGSWAEDSLQRGWYDLMTANPNPEFIEKNPDLVKAMSDPNNNMFSWKVFFISFSVILFFYFLISSIFAMFLKNRRL